jgi:hypothetical protein
MSNLVKFESKLKALFLTVEGKDVTNLNWMKSIHIINTDLSTIQKIISQHKELPQSSLNHAIRHLLPTQIKTGNSNPSNYQLSSIALQVVQQITSTHFQESISDSDLACLIDESFQILFANLGSPLLYFNPMIQINFSAHETTNQIISSFDEVAQRIKKYIILFSP